MNSFSKSAARTISFCMLCLACTALTPIAARAQAEASAEEISSDSPDEIIVTATRRGLKISDVPLSISAVSQDALTTRGVRDIADIAYVSPGVSVINNNDGDQSISVRGIVALGSRATTAFYIDETPILQASGGTFSPRYFDIERVEVLRGPQGTLFGASAMGGAIRVITKRPNLSRFEGSVRAEGSRTRLAKENYVLDGAVSVPIISDVLALRVTGFYEKQSGWAKAFTPVFSDDPADYVGIALDRQGNPRLDEFGDPITDGGVGYKGITGSGRRVGDQTVYGARASLLFQPVDALKLTSTYHWQKRKNDGFNNSDNSIGLGLPGTDFRQARATDEFRNLRSQLANLTGEFDAGFAKLTSSTSYEWNRESNLIDLSGVVIPNVVGIFGVLPRDSQGRAGSPQRTDNDKTNFTQEVRLVSSGDGPFSWILGAYYNRSKDDQFQSYQVRGIAATAVGGPFEGAFPGDIIGSAKSQTKTREMSFFGEVGYKFSDKLSATVGLRRYSVTTGLAVENAGFIASDPVSLASKENGFSYKAVLNYKPNDDLLLFAGYTTGYRPGGPNPRPLVPEDKNIPDGFKSDKLAQYEFGWKSSWLDRALTVNGALFYIDWSDIPTNVTAFSGLQYIINGPKARNYGAELEFVIRPTKGFDVSFGLTVLKAEYSRDFSDEASGLRILKGDRLPNVPDITLNAGLDYVWSIGGDTNARIGANVVHVTKRSQTANDTVAPIPGFVNAGLSAGIDFGTFDVSIFARNIFDTRALVANTPFGREVSGGIATSPLSLSYLQPRTIGASVQFKF